MPPKNLISYIVFSVILLAIFIVPNFFGLLTDWYWFQEIGFSNVFTTILITKIILGLSVGILSFVIIYCNLWLAKRLVVSRPLIVRLPEGVGAQTDMVRKLDLTRYMNTFALPISLILGFFTGLAGASSWETVLKYFNATPFGVQDPIFGRDIAYYFFHLPFVQSLVGLGFWLIIASLIGAAASYALRGAIAFNYPGPGAGIMKSLFMDKPAKMHLSILIALLFVLTSFKIYAVRIPYLLYSSAGPFTGARFTDIHAMLPFLKILIFVAVAAAILVIINIFKSGNHLIVLAVGFYFLVSILGGWVYPALLQKFVVAPNELIKETPYIKYNIKATQKAFALDKIAERNLTGESVLTMADINNNRSTIKNVRLWDREPLLDTFGQLQEIRTYYDFISIDNDRYHLNGDYRQVLLSPRELNPASLPQRTFINEHLTFTHGFGLTLTPVNEVTSEGLPVLFLKDLPPTSSVKSLSVSRPEIYYGELAGNWVVVNTRTKEFNYPSGEANVFANYEGGGGVRIGSMFRKALFALRFGSLKILLSNDITPDSRIMYYRNIEERVKRVMPFLRLDSDPYMVVTKKGELKWIYDGKMTFYIADKDDPVIQTYAKIFKGSFVPLEKGTGYFSRHT